MIITRYVSINRAVLVICARLPDKLQLYDVFERQLDAYWLTLDHGSLCEPVCRYVS
jgi:hypothetical protein